jgi:CBS domain-containing protein
MSTGAVVTVEPEETLRAAADRLTASGVTGAPVTANGHVVGVVSLTDITQFEADDPGVPTFRPELLDMEESAVEEPEVDERDEQTAPAYFAEMWPDAGADVVTRIETETPEWNSLDEHFVSEVMSRVLLSVEPGSDVRAAAKLMVKNDVRRLLVMEDGALVGILSAWDVVRGVANGKVDARDSGRAA